MLRLVTSNEPKNPQPREPRQLTAPTTRPTERHEAWSLERVEIEALAEEAVGLEIDLGVACSVVIERRDLIATVGDDALVQWLDDRAWIARPVIALSAPSSAYLRSLNGNSLAEVRSTRQMKLDRVAMPARLNDRLLRLWPPSPDLEGVELGPALQWERASVMAGMTMTEWAFKELASRR